MNNKIAYFLNIYPKLSETFIEREIIYLKKLEYDVRIYAIRKPNERQENISSRIQDVKIVYAYPGKIFKGIILNLYFILINPIKYLKCVGLIFRNIYTDPIPEILKQFVLLFISTIFLNDLKKKEIDLVHAHFSNACSIALFCKVINPNINYGFTAHASADIFYKTILLQEKIKYAKYIIAISDYNKRYLNLISDYLYDEKIFVVHNGVEIKESIKSTDTSSDATNIKLLSVGDFTYCKGYPTLIESLNILRVEGYNFILNIIGDGIQKEMIQYLIKKYKLENNVSLLGPLNNEDVMKDMEACDIFILASEIYLKGKRDGIPTVCIEAMSVGKPVISTFISGIPELIENGITGLLVPERNPKALSSAITNLIENKDLRIELGKNGYEFVKDNFNIEKTIILIKEIFDKVINEKD